MAENPSKHKGIYGDGSTWITEDYFDKQLDLSGLKDRGTKKWTSLMLPEHIAMLKEAEVKRNYLPKPELDPQEREDMDRIIREAMEFTKPIKFTYWTNGKFAEFIGYVAKMDTMMKELRLFEEADGEGERLSLPFADVVSVEIV